VQRFRKETQEVWAEYSHQDRTKEVRGWSNTVTTNDGRELLQLQFSIQLEAFSPSGEGTISLGS